MAVYATHRPSLIEVRRLVADGQQSLAQLATVTASFGSIRRQYGSDWAWSSSNPTRVTYVGTRPLMAWIRFVMEIDRSSGTLAGDVEIALKKNGSGFGPGVAYPCAGVSGSSVGNRGIPFPPRQVYMAPNDYLEWDMRQSAAGTFLTVSLFAICWTTGFGPAGDGTEETLT